MMQMMLYGAAQLRGQKIRWPLLACLMIRSGKPDSQEALFQ